MIPSSATHDIRTLILSYHSVIAIETVEEERVKSLLRHVAAEMGIPLFEWSLTRGLARSPNPSMFHGTADPQIMLRHIEGLTIEGIFLLKDLAPHLQAPAVCRQFRELSQRLERTRSSLVLTGSTVDVPQELAHRVVFYHLKLPGQGELKEVLEAVMRSLRETDRFDVDLRPGDLHDLIQALGGMTLNQARQAIAYAILEDGRLDTSDIRKILDRKAEMIREGGLLEYFPAEDNHFMLGGFANLKGWLDRASIGFSPEAQALNLSPPRGILIVGVQGCGKSLASKVIAGQWTLPLLKLDAGRLYDKYVGESERNFRKATALAESMAPAVLWIDEIEKGFGASSGGDADGGLSRRILGAFLTWLQEKKRDVFVVATANDLSVLPPEFLRKGRFDEVFFVDLPNAAEREAIFEIHLRLRKQSPQHFDLASLVQATEGYSGAEIEQAIIASLYRALHDRERLSTSYILQEIDATVPLSVSRREDIEALRHQAAERFVPVR